LTYVTCALSSDSLRNIAVLGITFGGSWQEEDESEMGNQQGGSSPQRGIFSLHQQGTYSLTPFSSIRFWSARSCWRYCKNRVSSRHFEKAHRSSAHRYRENYVSYQRSSFKYPNHQKGGTAQAQTKTCRRYYFLRLKDTHNIKNT